MRTEETRTEELLALGMFGRGSRLRERIEILLEREREFSPRLSRVRVAMSAAALLGCVVAAAVAPRVIAFAQEKPTFEVASVKPSNAGSPMTGVGVGRSNSRNVTLKSLMTGAYRVQEFQIYGGPSWVGTDRFDVDAKAEDPSADPDQVRLMLQSLLEDRFKLRIHREMRESPVYALVVDKSGLKMKQSSDQISPSVDGPSPPGAGPNHGAIRIGAGSLIGNAATMTVFTRMLSQRLDRLIVDKTGLAGRIDIQLQWTPGVGEAVFDPLGNPLPPADSSGPSVFTAVQEQLGLKLESARAPVEVLMIDHAEKPDAN